MKVKSLISEFGEDSTKENQAISQIMIDT